MSASTIALSLLVFLALPAFSVHGENVIRSVSALQEACRDNRRFHAFELTGTVITPTDFHGKGITLLVGDELSTVYDIRNDRTVHAAVGDLVVVSGQTEPSGSRTETSANCYDLRVIGSRPLPSPVVVGIHDFCASSITNKGLVAVRGVLQDVFPDDLDAFYICAVLRDGTDTINLLCNCTRDNLPGFRKLVGCDLVVTGVRPSFGRKSGRYPRPLLMISGTNAFHVISRPGDFPFDTPEFVIDNVSDPRSITELGMRRVRGIVLASWGETSFLIRTANGRIACVDLAESPLPKPSDSVEAAGIIETDLCDITLSRAFWRPAPSQATPAESPVATPLSGLFISKITHRPTIDVLSHGKLLTVCGTVKNISHGAGGSRRLLLAADDHTILVICGPDAQGNPPPEEGWRIAVTGVCVKDSDVWRPTVPIPRIRGLFLVTRSDKDIVILRKAPWWTPARLATAIAILIALLVAIVIWNATLRVLVARRSREVIKAQSAKLESELRIDERTRLAADLHDNTVQNLTAIAYRITAAQGALGSREPEAGRILQVAAKMLKSCRTNLRQCLWDLRNDALNEPDFETAIRRTVETVAGDARLSIRFSGRRDLINDTTAHAALSILRELVSNATVHGGATAVSIAGEAHPGAIRFSVSDNGTGFDPAQRPGQDDGHFGLDGITERLESLGGTLDITSSAGKGTYVRISIQSKSSPQDDDQT